MKLVSNTMAVYLHNNIVKVNQKNREQNERDLIMMHIKEINDTLEELKTEIRDTNIRSKERRSGKKRPTTERVCRR